MKSIIAFVICLDIVERRRIGVRARRVEIAKRFVKRGRIFVRATSRHRTADVFDIAIVRVAIAAIAAAIAARLGGELIDGHASS